MLGTRASPFREEAVRHRVRRDSLEAMPPRRQPASPFERLFGRRMPVVLQQTIAECGAACLAMVLAWFGRASSLDECREQCGGGRDGVTAQALLEAARAFGLRGRAFKLDPNRFAHVPLPAIVHWELDHFLVVEGWSRTGVDVIDPAVGRRRLTADEFDAGFTGVVLVFEPGLGFRPAHATQAPAWKVCLRYALAAPSAGLLAAQVLVASLVLQVPGLTMPLLTEVLVDRIVPGGLNGVVPTIGAVIVIVCLVQGVLTYSRGVALVNLQERLDERMTLAILEHLLSLPYRFFQARTNGDLLARVSSGATVAELLAGQTVSIVLDGALVVVYLAILFLRDPSFGAAAVVLGALQAAVLLFTARRTLELTRRRLLADADVQGNVVELLNGIATVKASGVEGRGLDRSAILVARRSQLSLEQGRLNAATEACLMALRMGTPLTFLWLAMGRILDGSASLGAMLGLVALATACLLPLASLVSTTGRLQLAILHFERLADIFRAGPEQADLVPTTPALGGRIELRNVSYRYDRTEPWIVRNVSLTVEPGQKAALVGPSGSGKTTLAMLILGLLEPTEGEVLYDSRPLRSLSRVGVRQQLGVVLQEPFLFSGSVRQNVAFADPGLSPERIEEAAKLAVIHDEIIALPMGYDTRLGDGGAGLSGGQRQRLALARALSGRPALLVLDEATSHLDLETEQRVEANLSALRCTRIVIAHRLSMVRTADIIMVLDDGAIAERGGHDALMALDGRYAQLARRA
jgi:ABC-type bacteriocin/lantibiotic exporter with double-glycine peptidase domain